MTESAKDRQWSVKYRPMTLNEMIGNESAVSRIKSTLKKGNSHAMLLYGNSGCGKSTLARIIANHVATKSSDIRETNVGADTGVQATRSMIEESKFLPRGAMKVFILEECHAMTQQAKNALLRPLEDPPHDKLMWILCTDRPWMLDRQILNRMMQIKVDPPSQEQLSESLQMVVKLEGAFPDYKDKAIIRICDEIAVAADCVPRAALQLLQVCAADYKNFESPKDLIVQSIRNSGDAQLDKNALKVLAAIYSMEKDLPFKVNFVAANASSVDAIGLLNRLIFVNHNLLLAASGNPAPVSHYFVKELTGMKAVPKVSAATRVSLVLTKLKQELAVINVDPAQILLPTLINLVLKLGEDK